MCFWPFWTGKRLNGGLYFFPSRSTQEVKKKKGVFPSKNRVGHQQSPAAALPSTHVLQNTTSYLINAHKERGRVLSSGTQSSFKHEELNACTTEEKGKLSSLSDHTTSSISMLINSLAQYRPLRNNSERAWKKKLLCCCWLLFKKMQQLCFQVIIYEVVY